MDMQDCSVDMVFTDPPYKISQDYGTGVDADNLIGVAGFLKVMPEIARVLKPGRFAAIFYDNRILPLLFEAAHGTGLTYHRQLFVYRSNSMHVHRWHGWMGCTDPIALFVKKGAKKFMPAVEPPIKHDCYTRVKMNASYSGHPAQKPLEIVEHILLWCTDASDLVVDPYCGSGTVCQAAVMHGRNYVGIDNNPEYVSMATKRTEYVRAGNQGAEPVQRLTAAGQNTGNALELDL